MRFVCISFPCTPPSVSSPAVAVLCLRHEHDDARTSVSGSEKFLPKTFRAILHPLTYLLMRTLMRAFAPNVHRRTCRHRSPFQLFVYGSFPSRHLSLGRHAQTELTECPLARCKCVHRPSLNHGSLRRPRCGPHARVPPHHHRDEENCDDVTSELVRKWCQRRASLRWRVPPLFPPPPREPPDHRRGVPEPPRGSRAVVSPHPRLLEGPAGGHRQAGAWKYPRARILHLFIILFHFWFGLFWGHLRVRVYLSSFTSLCSDRTYVCKHPRVEHTPPRAAAARTVQAGCGPMFFLDIFWIFGLVGTSLWVRSSSFTVRLYVLYACALTCDVSTPLARSHRWRRRSPRTPSAPSCARSTPPPSACGEAVQVDT
jgi:hypothetical protein